MNIEVGDKLRSLSEDRVVRVIEIERGLTGEPRRLRVENTMTKRRTFLRYPLLGRWLFQPDHGRVSSAPRP